MKKLVMMLVCMFAVHTMVMADNDKPIEVSQLPAKAQTFIKTYFKDHKVAMAKLESGMFYKAMMWCSRMERRSNLINRRMEGGTMQTK